MRPPWWKRLPGGPPAIELDADTFGGRVQAGQRKTIHVKPPADTSPENPDDYPWLPEADRLNLWRGLAQSRLGIMEDLRDENARLRADLALAVHARTRLVECGHEATLRRYDAREAQCRAEHLDGDEAERLRNAAYPKMEVPW